VRLPAGLVALAIPLPALHATSVNVRLRIGPRYEQAENNGLSHFLEHMLYRGTRRHPSAHAQAAAFEALGSSLGAATYVDHGAMSVAIPPDNLGAVLELLGEVYREPLLEGIDLERGIVTEEILDLLDDDNNPIDTDVLVRALSFAGHPLGFPITGSIEQIGTFDQARLQQHHARHYTASHTVVAVAGPLDPQRTLAQIERAFQGLSQGGALEAEPPPEQSEPRFEYRRRSDSKTALRLAFRAPGEATPDEPAVELLLRVLDDGMSTRLYRRICDERGLCYDVAANYEAYADGGLFDIAAETAHERAGEVLAELVGIVKELRDAGPSEEELAKTKTRLHWQLTEMLDHPSEIAEFFALTELGGGVRSPLERFEQLGAVTARQARAAAERLFRAESLSVVAVGALGKKQQQALAARVKSFA